MNRLSVKFRGREVENPVGRALIIATFSLLFPIFLVIVIPLVFLLHPIFRLFGRAGTIQPAEAGKVNIMLDRNSFKRLDT